MFNAAMIALIMCILLFIFLQVARHTRPEAHFKVRATTVFFQRRLQPTPRAETGLHFYSPYGCRLGYLASCIGNQNNGTLDGISSPDMKQK